MDIAKRVNTSPATVSYALNNNGKGVSEQTRDRILRAADEMGYRPNRRAQQLRSGATKTLAFQLDSSVLNCNRRRVTATLPMTIFQGAARYARDQRYHAYLLMPPDGDDLGEARRQVLEERSFDGIILSGFDDEDQRIGQFTADLKKAGIPAVSVDRRLIKYGIPFVGVGRERGITEASDRIAEHGHRMVAYVGLQHATFNEPEPRSEVFRRALAEHDVELSTQLSPPIATEIDSYRAIRSLLENLSADQRPTCLIFGGDHLAMAGMQAVADLGLEVPTDLSIVAMNNAPYAREAPLPLCTIDHRYRDMGVMLSKSVIDHITDPKSPLPESTMLPALFIDNDSLGPAPRQRRAISPKLFVNPNPFSAEPKTASNCL